VVAVDFELVSEKNGYLAKFCVVLKKILARDKKLILKMKSYQKLTKHELDVA
jgi:hypothetical protein